MSNHIECSEKIQALLKEYGCHFEVTTNVTIVGEQLGYTTVPVSSISAVETVADVVPVPDQVPVGEPKTSPQPEIEPTIQPIPEAAEPEVTAEVVTEEPQV